MEVQIFYRHKKKTPNYLKTKCRKLHIQNKMSQN